MGSIEMSVNKFVAAREEGSGLTLEKDGECTGTLVIHKALITGVDEESSEESVSEPDSSEAPVVPKPTFIDYLEGGCEINLCVAIDFTGSNGNPREPGTLHYLDPTGESMNDYEKAIKAIGSVLGKYDTDKKYPVWGFGAKFADEIFHLFQCGQTSEVDGIPGVLDAYHQTFKSGLVMSGPTVFTEVITTTAGFSQNLQQRAREEGKQTYSILLILTDGSVADVEATVECLKMVQDSP